MVIAIAHSENGQERTVDIEKNDLIAEIKFRIINHCFPLLNGQMITLSYRGQEMDDDKLMGKYGLRYVAGERIYVQVSPRQPYAGINYGNLARMLIEEGKKPKSFDEWKGKWDKGDEYLSYPPVDVNNKWSSIPPSKSTELASPSAKPHRTDHDERADAFRRARGHSYSNSPRPNVVELPVRTFQSCYVCQVFGSRFEILHKMEGKWVGESTSLNSQWKAKHEGENVSSSCITFNDADGHWIERQQVTNPSGISQSQKYCYVPRSHGICEVEVEESRSSPVHMALQEVGSNVILITTISLITGQPVTTETITLSADFQQRVRTVQRFDNNGRIIAVCIYSEQRYIDAETGALEKRS